MESEVLIFKMINVIFKKLEIENYTIKFNFRDNLYGLFNTCSIPYDKFLTVCSSLDKLDKIGEIAVIDEIISKGIDKESVIKLFDKLNKQTLSINIVNDFSLLINHYFQELHITNYKFDPFLARGLDYYTGIIYEIVINDNIGSVAGGGRYDELISSYTQTDIKTPAIGISFGVYRIMNVMISKHVEKNNKTIFIAGIGENMLLHKLELFNKLIENGFVVDLFFKDKNIKQQLKYCNKNNIRYVLIIANDELSKEIYILKDLSNKTQLMITSKYDHIMINKLGDIIDEKYTAVNFDELDVTKIKLCYDTKQLLIKLPSMNITYPNEEKQTDS